MTMASEDRQSRTGYSTTTGSLSSRRHHPGTLSDELGGSKMNIGRKHITADTAMRIKPVKSYVSEKWQCKGEMKTNLEL